MDALVNFYDDPKSQFFPAAISKSIRDFLIQAESTFAGLPVEALPIAEDAATSILKLLEDLYVYCLKYGLITYGFSGKIAQEQIEKIRSARQQAEAATKKMLATATRLELEQAAKLEHFEKSLAQAEADFNTKVIEQLNALKPSIDDLGSVLAMAKSNASEIGNFLNMAGEHTTAVGNIRTEFVTAATTATEEFTARKTTADAEVATIQASSLQVQKFESDVKTMHQAVTDARAKMTDQLTQITSFYGELEAYRLQITEGGKVAQANLADLRQSSEVLVNDLSDRTKQVVKTNESLLEQIKDHLQKAIGASLFKAFDTRRRAINISSWVWATLLLLSVGGMIWFAVWFVNEVAAVAEIAKVSKEPPSGVAWMLAYSRLVIVAPLAFLIAFTAKRYTSERRAEEEWAFKSAISVSLDPFRDLIARMKLDGHETAFVERLVAEIFDNPTKRLYGASSEKSEKSEMDILGLVKDALDKIPKQT